jgi:hypothetical protein
MAIRYVDLDSEECGSNPIDAIYFLKGKDIIFIISTDNPYYEDITKTFQIEILKKNGGKIFFIVHSGG